MSERGTYRMPLLEKAAYCVAATAVLGSGGYIAHGVVSAEEIPTVTYDMPVVEAASLTSPATVLDGVTRESCVEPTAEDLAAVDRLLAEPKHPALSISGKGTDEEMAAYSKYIDEVATETGVTMHVGYDLLGILANDFYNQEKSPMPFEQYFSVAQNYMQQFGVTLSIGTPDLAYSYGGRAPTAEELETDNARKSMMNLIEAYSTIPEDRVEYSGLKSIVIMTGTASQEVGGYATVQGEHDTYFMDIEPDETHGPFTITGASHELGHLADAEDCGPDGMREDPSFARLNEGLDIYEDTATEPAQPGSYDPLTYEEYKTNESERSSIMHDAKQAGDTETFCAVLAEDNLEAAQVVTASDYHPRPSEEKAEIEALISKPYLYGDITDKRYGKFSQKVRFQMARYYHQLPNVMTFLIKTASPSYKDPAETIC